jgi:hypothetical protein
MFGTQERPGEGGGVGVKVTDVVEDLRGLQRLASDGHHLAAKSNKWVCELPLNLHYSTHWYPTSTTQAMQTLPAARHTRTTTLLLFQLGGGAMRAAAAAR